MGSVPAAAPAMGKVGFRHDAVFNGGLVQAGDYHAHPPRLQEILTEGSCPPRPQPHPASHWGG